MNPVSVEFRLHCNVDVMALLAEQLSNQYLFPAGISKECSNIWGKQTKTTQAITADTSASQLQWSYDSDLKLSPTICEPIAEHCTLVVLRCAHSNGCVVVLQACFKAAARNDLEMIPWALDQNCCWSVILRTAAAAGGSLRILKWARKKGFPRGVTACSEAAGSGHLGILQWARSKTRSLDSETCSKAAKGGHIDIFRWARAHGCDWNVGTCKNAAIGGNLELFQWARAEGCPWNKATCRSAIRQGHLKMLM